LFIWCFMYGYLLRDKKVVPFVFVRFRAPLEQH
jgi:hypothetical protein